jgi:hypothetical protein
LDVIKDIVFEFNYSIFNGREYVKGNVKNLLLKDDFGEKTKLKCLRNYFKNYLNKSDTNYVLLSNEETEKFLNTINANGFDTAILLNNIDNLHRFKKLFNFDINLFKTNLKSNKNALIIGPNYEDLSTFKRVVFIDKPLKISSIGNIKTYINTQLTSYTFENLTCDREVMISAFKIIKNGISLMKNSAENIYFDSTRNICLVQFAFAYEVFCELGIVNDSEFPKLVENVKSELENSKIYLGVKRLLEKTYDK